jgi:anti-sigma regulatory factor (Ser/Thr protein kinase)
MTASPVEAAATWPPQASSVGEARRFCGSVLDAGVEQAVRDVAMLVVTELVTNAVLHARTEFTVTVQRVRRGVLLRVGDHAPERAAAPDLPGLPESGRGLVLVDLLATAWGVTADGVGGKAVWALLGDDDRTSTGGSPLG